ncbi:unnamed protein product [Caenorhabditis angaria]|uniref:Uncharacterized protein n=1 Tax=Caenorhabditis angaria TaxID=860376 RepID=A0A9P1I689_9PELO|nr:unnamed protein product [Caenorhabditis angaria]
MKKWSRNLLFIILFIKWVTAQQLQQQQSRGIPAFRVPISHNQRLNLRPPPPQPPSPVRHFHRQQQRFRQRQLLPSTTTSQQFPPNQAISRNQAIIRQPIQVRRKPLITLTKPVETIMRQSQQRIRHQPIHAIRTNNLRNSKIRKNRLLSTKPSQNQSTLPPTSTLAQTTTLIASSTTIPTTISNSAKQVNDIEADILRAVIDSSTTTIIPPVQIQSSTLRARTHRLKTSFSRSRVPFAPPPLPPIPLDSIEAAVLKAVLQPPITTVSIPITQSTTTPILSTTTTVPLPSSSSQNLITVPPTLFPAFALKRRIESTTIPTTTTSITSIIPNISTIDFNSTISLPTTKTLIVEGTTVSNILNNESGKNEDEQNENLKLREIEENIIAALISSSPIPPPSSPSSSSSSTSSSSFINGPPGISPPSSFAGNSAGPPGSQPPSDKIVDELNVANNFMEVAQKLNLFKLLLQ